MRSAFISPFLTVALGTTLPFVSADAVGQDADLAGHFGFDPLEVVPVGPRAGALGAADVDGDGLVDLVIANNHKSRVEILRQRPGATPADLVAPRSVNELPEHWRFERLEIPMNIEVGAVELVDLDEDGLLDLVVAGRPDSVQVFRQTSPGEFERLRRHRIRNLMPTRDGLLLQDVIGSDGPPEVVGLVGGKVRIWPIEPNGKLGTAQELTAGDEKVIAVLPGDFDGDGLTDLAGVVPDDESPIRLWLASRNDGEKTFGPQLRFEMPSVVEAMVVPGEDADRLAVIERPTKRVVVYDLVEDAADGGEPSFEVHGFTDAGQRDRDIAIVDLDGDGLLDVLSTDRSQNSIAHWRQIEGRGLRSAVTRPTFAQPDAIEAGDVDGDGVAEVFVLSEEEGVVGRAATTNGEIGFPEPLLLPAGHEPKSMKLIDADGKPVLAVVAKKDRDFALDLMDPSGGDTVVVDLGRLSRGPDTILDLDADQDGRTDILLFTDDRPMVMIRNTEDGYEMIDKDGMPQFGLVSAASADNTGRFDVDGDGYDELLVADRNYVRSLRFDPEKGWTVVSQANADGESKLVSVEVVDGRLAAVDQEGRRLLMFERSDDVWGVVDEIPVRGIRASALRQGGFRGNASQNDLLLIGDDAFAVVQMDGPRPRLAEGTGWRPDDNRTVPHELGLGDVNADGFQDLIALDAGQQSAQILSLSRSGALRPMTNFKIFESKIFSGGEPREYEPREVVIADVTGDGADDLILVAHDRILLYPQMTVPGDEDA